jgi:cytoskeletal protein RodZ
LVKYTYYQKDIIMELLFVLGIVVAIIAILYIQRKKDKPTVESVVAEPAPYKVPEPPTVTTIPTVVEETTTPAPVAVVEPAPIVVEETVAIVEETPAVEKPAAKPKRAKVNGKFAKDDPATLENEAWEGGVAPPKKPKAPPKPRSKKG